MDQDASSYRMTDAATFSTILGIDPGLSGGIACKNDQAVTAFPMPQTEGDLIELLRTLIVPGKTVVFLEEVGGFTGKGQPGSAMFKFGRNFGFVLGVIQTMNVRVELVRPQKWQKPFGLGTASSCETRTDWKGKLRALAQRLYPELKPTLATADAILIMEYGLKSLRPGTVRQ
jgi:crossover junction endodeoxyribonuclease RuvC